MLKACQITDLSWKKVKMMNIEMRSMIFVMRHKCVVYLDEEEDGDDDDDDDICWGHKGVVYHGLGTAGAVT